MYSKNVTVVYSESEPSTEVLWCHRINGEVVYQVWSSNGWTTIATDSLDAKFKTLNDKIDSIPAQVQSDWNQNNSTKADYIKNRICSEHVTTSVFFDGSIELSETEASGHTYNEGVLENCSLENIIIDKEYSVKIGNNSYICIGTTYTGISSLLYGDYDNKSDFINIYKADDTWYIETSFGNTDVTNSVKLSLTETIINKIDDKFINLPCYKHITLGDPIYTNASEITATVQDAENFFFTINDDTLNTPFSEGKYIKLELKNYKNFEGTVFLYNGNAMIGNPVFFGGDDNGLDFAVRKQVAMGGYITISVVWERDLPSKTFAIGDIKMFNPTVDIKVLDEEMIPSTIARETSLNGVLFKKQNNNLYTSLDSGITWLTVSVS